MSNNFKPLSEQVAEKLIKEISEGSSVFQRKAAEPLIMPFNASTGKNYRGVPALILLMKNEQDPRWMTMDQGNYKKSGVIKDEKSTVISFYKTHDMQPVIKDGQPVLNENDKPKMESVKLEEPVLTTAFLFNARQFKNMPELATVMAERQAAPADDRIMQIINNSGISTDKLGHTPMEAVRALAEHFVAKKPSESTIKDALRTNIAALFAAAEMKLPFELADHLGYPDAWAVLLKQEPAELFKAANDAQKVADKILGLEKKRSQETEKAGTLNKGDEIAYKGDTIKVLAILKGKVAQIEYSNGTKLKVAPTHGLYTALAEAKTGSRETAIEQMNEPAYATGR